MARARRALALPLPLALLALALAPAPQAHAAFLEDELPLKVLSVLPQSTAPQGRGGDAGTRLRGRAALSVIFSRAVIALGSDWSEEGDDGALSAAQTPFSLEACPGQPAFAVPGRLRWATTSIARFDAGIDWPTDLCFDLVLNPALRTYDGLALASLAGGAQTRWRFSTGPVRMSVQGVSSPRASALTSGRWSSRPLAGGSVHEVPPDADVFLSFSSEIDHDLAFAALRSANPGLLGEGSGTEQNIECGKRCLIVRPRGLQSGLSYKLSLPAGAQYSKVAGRVGKELSVSVSGLLPFSFPFWFKTPPAESWRNRKFQYRRYHLYLLHGLKPDVDEAARLGALKAAIAFSDAAGKHLPFTLKLVDNATLQMDVPTVLPKSSYTISVSASADVLDGFGQALQASSMSFGTGDAPNAFMLPQAQPSAFRHFPYDWQVLATGRNAWCSNSKPATEAFFPSPFAGRGDGDCASRPYEVRAWPVAAESIGQALTYRHQQQRTDVALPGEVKLTAPAQLGALQALPLDASKLLRAPAGEPQKRGGLFLSEMRQGDGYASRSFVSVASFGASLVATAGNALIVWATRFSDGAPVSGAAVSVYRVPSGWSSEPSESELVASGTTDKQGLAVLQPRAGEWSEPQRPRQLAAFLESEEHGVALCEETPVPQLEQRQEQLQGAVVTDRAIYKPGDTVHVKGYVRNLDASGRTLTLPRYADGYFALDVQWGGATDQASPPLRTSLPLDETFGTWSANLTVPAGRGAVGFGDIPLTLVHVKPGAAGGDEELLVTSATVVVADPRPPTVALNISSSAKVVAPGADAALDVELRTRTYSGAAVGGAVVTLTWRLNRAAWSSSSISGAEEIVGTRSLSSPSPAPGRFGGGPMPMMMRGGVSVSSDSLTGEVKATTDSSGATTYRLRLAELLKEQAKEGVAPPRCEEGDTVSVTARWVGPTREVVTEALEDVKVARSPYSLAARPSKEINQDAGMPLPGVPWGVAVELRDDDGEVVPEAVATVSLYEWDGAPLPESLLPAGAWGNKVAQSCELPADGSAAVACASTLTLPEAKKYVVLVEASDPDGVKLLTAFSVGKTPQEWQERPLQQLDGQLKAHLDKSSYAVGDTATITVVPPFDGASALIVWGGGATVLTKVVALGKAGEASAVALEVGDECALGCGVLVVTAAPDQSKEQILPVPVPVSPLLDVTLPRSLTASLRLHVPERRASFEEGSVQLSVTAAGGREPLAVAQPGSKVSIKVALPPEGAGAEICLMVTDQAMLEVGAPAHPHELADVGDAFHLARGGQPLGSADTRTALASSEGYRAFLEAAVRRGKLDPWLVPSSWQLAPTPYSLQPVERSDEEYLDRHTDDLTQFPSGGMMMARNYGGPEVAEMEAMPMMDGGPMMEKAVPLMAMRSAAPPMAPMAMAADMAVSEGAPVSTTMAPAGGSRQSMRGGGGGGGGQVGQAMYLRTHFQTTPLFVSALVADASGKAEVELTLPDNIATFAVRAYVVDGRGESRFGRAETKLISRREVSLMPSLPRIVHPGDRFECGVTVTRHGEAAEGLQVTASLAPGAALQLRVGAGGQLVALALQPGGPEEVLFPFEAPDVAAGGGVGEANLTFAVAKAAGAPPLDALSATIPVQAPQDAVTVATSMAITATAAGGEWAEGLVLPQATPGSGSLRLTAGVGHLPAVMDGAAELASLDLDNGESLVSALLPIAALRLYTPPGGAYGTMAIVAEAMDVFVKAQDALPAYTDSSSWNSKGLMWDPSERQAQWARASVSLNAFGLLVARLLQDFESRAVPGPACLRCPGGALPKRVAGALEKAWAGALEGELRRQLEELYARRPGQQPCTANCYTAWDTIAEVRASLGHAWQPSDPRMVAEFAMDRLFSQVDALSPLGLANAALAYTLHSEGGLPPEAAGRLEQVYTRLANLVRIQGRTTYLAAAPDSPHSAGLRANAAALLAIARAEPSAMDAHFAARSGSSLAARLAGHVAGGGGRAAPFGGGRWVSARDSALMTAALAAYDSSLGMALPDVAFSGASGGVGLVAYEAHGEAKAPVMQETPWSALPRDPAPVKFTAVGRGEVTVVAALHFVPAKLPVKGAVYRGLFVEKVIRKMDTITGEAVGPPLQVVALGTPVVVTIQITTPDDLSRVVLEDIPSGGLEPVDASVAGDSRGNTASNGCNGGRFAWWWWCWPSMFQTSIRPGRVRWSSQSTLYAATHTVSYQAMAVTRGVFTVPPAHAYVVDQPELLGLSRASTIVVAEPSKEQAPPSLPDPRDRVAVLAFLAKVGVEAPEAPAGQLPRACPGGCPNGGVCQLDTGKCACFSGVAVTEGDCEPKGQQGTLSWTGGAADALIPETYGATEPSPFSKVLVAMLVLVAAFIALAVYGRRKKVSALTDSFDDSSRTPYSAHQEGSETEMTSLVGRGSRGPSPAVGAVGAARGPWL